MDRAFDPFLLRQGEPGMPQYIFNQVIRIIINNVTIA